MLTPADARYHAPQVVLQELDGLKKGSCERARSSRDASRFLEDLAARDRQALRFARSACLHPE